MIPFFFIDYNVIQGITTRVMDRDSTKTYRVVLSTPRRIWAREIKTHSIGNGSRAPSCSYKIMDHVFFVGRGSQKGRRWPTQLVSMAEIDGPFLDVSRSITVTLIFSILRHPKESFISSWLLF